MLLITFIDWDVIFPPLLVHTLLEINMYPGYKVTKFEVPLWHTNKPFHSSAMMLCIHELMDLPVYELWRHQICDTLCGDGHRHDKTVCFGGIMEVQSSININRETSKWNRHLATTLDRSSTTKATLHFSLTQVSQGCVWWHEDRFINLLFYFTQTVPTTYRQED